MFKIPDFEEDVPKSHINFAKSLKKNYKAPEKTGIRVNEDITSHIEKQDDKSIFTVKESKKTKKKKFRKNNQVIHMNTSNNNNSEVGRFVMNHSLTCDNEDAVKTKSKKKKDKMTKQEVEIIKLDKTTKPTIEKKIKPIKANKRKLEDSTESNNTIICNRINKLDTDKIDEEILNVKKRKLNQALSNDDVEVDLFKEEIVKKTKNKNKKRNKLVNGNDSIQNECKIEKNGLENGSVTEIPAANSNNVRINSRKKEKISKILQKATNRTPIQTSGNKLRERMLEKLKSAQFRYLNEKLYTSSGTEAKELFQSDPTAFHTYHQGYQQQVKKWPVNPLDVIIKQILKMPKTCKIADLGCGDASLSRRVPHVVRSFDLVASQQSVEVCDMAHTPLCTGAMDAAVYCLALMGTELTQNLVEANRILKQGGQLLIAEVESRFEDVDAFTKDVMKLGFKLINLDKSHEVFFFMEFKKVTDPPIKKSKLPMLKLKPCFYKRR